MTVYQLKENVAKTTSSPLADQESQAGYEKAQHNEKQSCMQQCSEMAKVTFSKTFTRALMQRQYSTRSP